MEDTSGNWPLFIIGERRQDMCRIERALVRMMASVLVVTVVSESCWALTTGVTVSPAPAVNPPIVIP